MDRIRVNSYAVVGNDGSGINGMAFNPYRKSYSGVEDYVAQAKKFYGGNFSPKVEASLRARYELANLMKPANQALPKSTDLYQASWQMSDGMAAANTNGDRWLSTDELKTARAKLLSTPTTGPFEAAKANAVAAQMDRLLEEMDWLATANPRR